MTEPYQPGELVKLKSGGQPMTVTTHGTLANKQGGWVSVYWMTPAGDMKQENIPDTAVEKVVVSVEDDGPAFSPDKMRH